MKKLLTSVTLTAAALVALSASADRIDPSGESVYVFGDQLSYYPDSWAFQAFDQGSASMQNMSFYNARIWNFKLPGNFECRIDSPFNNRNSTGSNLRGVDKAIVYLGFVDARLATTAGLSNHLVNNIQNWVDTALDKVQTSVAYSGRSSNCDVTVVLPPTGFTSPFYSNNINAIRSALTNGAIARGMAIYDADGVPHTWSGWADGGRRPDAGTQFWTGIGIAGAAGL